MTENSKKELVAKIIDAEYEMFATCPISGEQRPARKTGKHLRYSGLRRQ